MMNWMKDREVWRFNLELLPPTLTKIGQQRKKKKRVRNLQIFHCKTIVYYVIRREQMFPFAKLFLKKSDMSKTRKNRLSKFSPLA